MTRTTITVRDNYGNVLDRQTFTDPTEADRAEAALRDSLQASSGYTVTRKDRKP